MRKFAPKFLHWCIATVLAKMAISLLGYNYDIESSMLIGDIVSNGKNVYAETHRYNYGPLWGYILGAFRWIQIHIFQSQSIVVFHVLIAMVLGIVDCGIAAILKRLYNLKAGYIFLLNPVSLLISGYHGQFDNVAILFGLLGLASLLQNNYKKAPLHLGLSLITKHILAFFSPWLLFNKNVKPLTKKAIVVVLPVILFLLSFLPFITKPLVRGRVLDNVLGYNLGRDNALLTKIVDWVFLQFKIDLKGLLTFLPEDPAKIIFVLTMLVLGFVLRKRPLLELFPLYLISLVAFTSQMSDQYLIIPLVGIAVFWKNWFLRLYLILTTLYLLFDAQSNIGGLLKQHLQFLNDSSFLSQALNVVFPQLLLVLFLMHSIFLKKTSKLL